MRVGFPLWFLAGFATVAVNFLTITRTTSVFLILLIEGAFVAMAVLCIRWADAYEPEPLDWSIWALVFGSGVSIGFLELSWEIPLFLQVGTFGSALMEEIVKALVLIIPFRKGLIDSWTDGFVYGSLAGLGFSISEDILYAASSDDGIATTLYRDINSILAHSLFSGIVGAIVIAGIFQRKQILLVIAIPLGAFIHAGWNTYIMSASSIATLFLAVMTPAAYFASAIYLRDIEKKQIMRKVDESVIAGFITLENSRHLWDLRQRKIFKKSLSGKEKNLFDRQVRLDLERLFAGSLN